MLTDYEIRIIELLKTNNVKKITLYNVVTKDNKTISLNVSIDKGLSHSIILGLKNKINSEMNLESMVINSQFSGTFTYYEEISKENYNVFWTIPQISCDDDWDSEMVVTHINDNQKYKVTSIFIWMKLV